MSRAFDGVDDIIHFSPGAMANMDGSVITIAWIWKPANLHAGGIVYGNGTGGNPTFAANNFSDGQIWYTANSAFGVIPWDGTEGWQCAAITNTSGATNLRGHRYRFAAPGWVHNNAASGIAASPNTPATSVFLGRWDASGDFLEGSLAVVGVWDRVLSNGEIEQLHTGLATWQALSPKWLVALNQSSVAIPITDLTGGGANQSSIVGTTVDADNPPGFSFDLTPPNINDLIVSKLKLRYPTFGPTFADLWAKYSIDNNSGNYFAGQALYDHYGGPEQSLQDRALRFWLQFVP